MTLEEYKALAAKAAAGDQGALLRLSQFGEQAIGAIAEANKAAETAKQDAAKAREENARILISMFSGPATTPGKAPMEDLKIPEYRDENGFPLRSTEYASRMAEDDMNAILDKEETNHGNA